MPDIDDTSLQGMGEALGESESQEVEVEETETEVEETQDQIEEASTEEEPQKIKLGEREFTSEELDELVGLGSRAKELGDSHGGFDKFVSEFGKKSERIGELNKRIEELQSLQHTDAAPEDMDQAVREAKEAARKLGLVSMDEIPEMMDKFYSERRAGERLLESARTLEAEIDGSDGRPKFDTEAVLKFMQQNSGFTDPQKAYVAMHAEEIANWKAEQLNKKSKKVGITTVTDTPSNKTPKEVRPNRDNLRDLIAEEFNN